MALVKGVIPEEAKFIESHEYILLDDDRGRVGISHYAAESLGDVVYVDLPSIGDVLDKGDPFGSIESVKAASDLYMPVSGEIIAVNTNLEDQPDQVNDDCYGGGWMIEIKVTKPDEQEELMEPEAYLAFLDASD